MSEVQFIPKKVVTVIEPKRSTVVDKEKYRQKRVAAYCRVSTGSDEQLNSYETQKAVYSEMIASRTDWCLAGIYADEGISGTRADKRKRFQDMINDCLKGKIDYIITKSVSRFARNTVDCLEYVRMLKARGIGIYFEEQNIDTLKNDSELYLVIYAGFAQSESESISKNITWSVRKKFEEGKVMIPYKKMLGYKKGTDGNPEIVPEEAVLVERIFKMYLAGETPRSISETLRNENIIIPNKSLSFTAGMITNILSNIKYTGDAILQQTITVDCITKTRIKNTGEEVPMYYVHNSHPAIISRELYNKAQEEKARRNTRTPKSLKTAITASGKYSKYALTDVLICGECGTRYRRCTWNIRGKKRIVWRCINRLENGTKYCKKSLTLDEKELHAAIVRAINRFNQEDSLSYMSLMTSTIGDAIGLNRNSDEIDLLKRRIDALNGRMVNLINGSIKDCEDIAAHEAELKEISAEIDQLQKCIDAIEQSESNDDSKQQRLQELQGIIQNRSENADKYDDSIVRQMIECIKTFPDGKLEIIFGGGYAISEYINDYSANNCASGLNY